MSHPSPESHARPTASSSSPPRGVSPGSDWSTERIVITGGAGFVGSNLVRRCLLGGAQVTVLDDFSTGSLANLPPASPRMQIVRGSVTDFATVQKAMSDATIVLHAAARNIIVSTRDPREDYEVNIGGTLNVLLAMRGAPSVKRTVYTSSASVYGNPRYLPINEDDQTNLLSPYSVSKFAGESYCKAFYESYGLSTSVVRYSNVYGPAQRPDNPYCGVIAKFFANAIARQPVSIHGDGEQTRDFTYVDDVVEATLLAAFSAKAEGQIYNIGTGRETRIKPARPDHPRGDRRQRSRHRADLHRPPRHRQHPPPRRKHRKDPPRAALGADHHHRAGHAQDLPVAV